MREVLEQMADGHQFYHARSPEYASTDMLPFRISPEPFYISKPEARVLGRIGQEVCSLIDATTELYETNQDVHELLDRGKPEVFQNVKTPNYLFLRPDLIITQDGFVICEIETSVFGLALADVLNRGYVEAGFDTIADTTELARHIEQTTPESGQIVYTNKTKAFAGQLAYLADKVFSGNQRDWSASHIDYQSKSEAIYRAHYLVEYLSDPDVKALYDRPDTDFETFPSITPQFEEKAILAFVWDNRFEEFYRQALGNAGFDLLRATIPPTWIVGEEQHFVLGLPNGLEKSVNISGLSSSKRKFVLKPSGFSADSSWSEGVSFLHKVSREKANDVLSRATGDSENRLYVIQAFEEGIKYPMQYEDGEETTTIQARVRLTPYFAYGEGKLLGIKATGCEGTQLIHASTASINTAVSVR